jgi:hypothetical protein
MTQTITLPKTWQVQITAGNGEILENWRRQQPNARTDYRCQDHPGKYLLSFEYDGTYLHFGFEGAKDTPTISFEDFKTKVLGKEAKPVGHPVGTRVVIKPGTTQEALQEAFDAVRCAFNEAMVHSFQTKSRVYEVQECIDTRNFQYLRDTNTNSGHYWPIKFFIPEPVFKPIAMACTAEEFKAIKPILISNGVKIALITAFKDSNYLVNNFGGRAGTVSNVGTSTAKDYSRTVHEKWNADLFLQSCGIASPIEKNIKPMNTTIKVTELKKIHDVACSTWKTRIEAMVPGPFAETVELTSEQIETMFAAANGEQTVILEQVFPDRESPGKNYRSFGESLQIHLESSATGMYIRKGHSRRHYELKEIGLTASGELHHPDGTVVNFPKGAFFLLEA